MAKQQSLKAYGAEYTGAYRVAATMAFDFIQGWGAGSYETFASAEAREAGEPPIPALHKQYRLSLSELATKILTPDEMSEFVNDVNKLRAWHYIIGSRIRETKPGYSQNERGEWISPEGKPVSEADATVNLFDGAVDV